MSKSIFRLIAFTVGAIACTNRTDMNVDPVGAGPQARPTVVTMAPDTLDFAVQDEQQTVFAQMTNADDSVLDDFINLKWVSRNPKVAFIDTGTIGQWVQVYARGSGSTWIVASRPDARDSVFVRGNIIDAPQKPLWRFTVAVGARTDATVAETRDAAQYMLNYVNTKFNLPGAFSGKFEFVLDSVFTYPKTSPLAAQDLMRVPRSAQYLILFDSTGNPGPNTGGVYLGATSSVQMLRGNWETDPDSRVILTHELGHARGAVDIYLYNRSSPVAGVPWLTMPASIMEAEGGSWDALSRVLIEHNAGVFPGPSPPGWRQSDFPSQAGVRILTRDGEPITGAVVLLRSPAPVPIASQTVVAQGLTNDKGEFIPEFNAFNMQPGLFDPKTWCGFLGCLNNVLFVEARYQGQTTYGWLTTMDAVAQYASHPGQPYLKRIRMGSPPA